MAVFFLLVGLEIKRELLEGELSSREQAVLPAIAAIGGMAVPAAHLRLDQPRPSPENLNGWAIPAATDIAFALGVLALLGSRAPLSLKVLLTAIAIFDDLGAIVIIAVFYTADLSLLSLALAAVALAVLLDRSTCAACATSRPTSSSALFLWVCVLKSGVHATLAGVALAAAIPLAADAARHSPLKSVEHGLHPWVAFGVLPLFGFANAGVSFAGMGWATCVDPITLGIALGLFLGKQIGIFGSIWLAFGRHRPHAGGRDLGADLRHGAPVRHRLHHEPVHRQPGLGSLDFYPAIRLGVLAGSIASAIAGAVLLRAAAQPGPVASAPVAAGSGEAP